ncbi:MAG: type II secretion system F family protein [Porticoccaceae bacterium]
MIDVWLPASLCLALLALGGVIMRRGWRRADAERVVVRLVPEGRGGDGGRAPGALERRLLRAGIRLPLWFVGGLAVAAVLLVVFVQQLFGWLAGLAATALIAAATALLYQWRYQRRLLRMVHQMPQLLDHMIRSLKSGRSLGDALLLAMANSQSPLREALAPTRRSVELGVPLGDALREFSQLYEREEFHILALGVRVNQRYGGNASELLDTLILMIRDREKAGRQLRALTGETRISALVLAGLPISLAGYIFVTNPEFFLAMLAEPTGRRLLYFALGLQVFGSYLLWRMLRSI